mgnify:CR=1 FL=1
MDRNHQVLNILKALADHNRLLIVSALQLHKEMCACQITELLDVTGATASRHLALLVNAGILNSRKDGRWIYYSISKTFTDEHGLLQQWIENIPLKQALTDEEASRLERIHEMDISDLCRKRRS